MTTLPTAAEITSLYLFGTKTPPKGDDLTNASIIDHAVGILPTIDTQEFMNSVAGRFIKPSQSELVRDFLAYPFGPVKPGTSMSAEEYAKLTGIDLWFMVTQAHYISSDETALEAATRSYIYNSQQCAINKDARFVVDADGTRHIENLRIELPEYDNFDFIGGLTSQLAAYYLEPKVDPSGIGKTVNIKYSGDYVVGNYNLDALFSDIAFIESSANLPVSAIELLFSGLPQKLFDDGITKLISSDGKAIVYGNKNGGRVDASDKINGYHEEAFEKGLVFVGSDKADNLDGVPDKDSTLNGNDGDDVLRGGAGNDTIDGGSGDDILIGGKGLDEIKGGAGTDLILSGSLYYETTLSDPEAKTETEVIDGGADSDYIVLSNESTKFVTIEKGGVKDHILLMPQVFGQSVASGSTVPLLFLNGGTSTYIRNYVNGELVDPDDTDSTASDGTKFRSYLSGDFDAVGTSSFVTYYWLFEENILYCSVLEDPDASVPEEYVKIDFLDYIKNNSRLLVQINNFNNGDFGINFEDFQVGETHAWDDDRQPEDSGIIDYSGAELLAEKKRQEHDLLDKRYSLTSDLTLIQKSNMAVAASTTDGSAASSLSADHLMMQANGTDQDDSFEGTGLGERFYGYAGNDSISAAGGNDLIYAGMGDDLMIGGEGADLIDGGEGIDTVDYSSSLAAVSVDLLTATVSGGDAQGDQIKNTENLMGSAFADVLKGDAGNNKFSGKEGNDEMHGGAGSDLVYGDGGHDLIYLDDGNDIAYGGTGNDFLTGVYGDDEMHGDVGNDAIYGGDGNDKLFGDDGDDKLYGWNGNDGMHGGAGSDLVYGDGGHDLIYLDDGNDIAYGGTGNDFLTGGYGDDVLYGDAGNDAIYGGDDNDKLFGGDGDDKLYGWNGNDEMRGGAGDDLFYGDDGKDILIGDTGNDTLVGGAGDDTYIYKNGDGTDVITEVTNYSGGNDKLDISGHTLAELKVARSGNDLVLTFANNADKITITNGANPSYNNAVETFLLAGGVTKTLAELKLLIPTTTSAVRKTTPLVSLAKTAKTSLDNASTVQQHNFIANNATDNGSSISIGSSGSDLYHFVQGDSSQIIVETSPSNDTDLDELDFGIGILHDDLWFAQSGKNLVISVLGSNDKVTVQDWYTGTGSQIEAIKSGDGKVLDRSSVQSLVDAMASFQPSAASKTSGVLPDDPLPTAVALVENRTWHAA